MTYNTVPDKATGDIFTEAMWDDSIKTNINNMIVPPACRVYKSSAQSIGTSSFATITFDQERFDTDGMHSTSSNTDRITIQTPGIYLVTGMVGFDSNAAGLRSAGIFMNGSTYLAAIDVPANSVGGCNLALSTIYEFAAGDYVTLRVWQNSGGALNVLAASASSPELAAIWLGRTS